MPTKSSKKTKRGKKPQSAWPPGFLALVGGFVLAFLALLTLPNFRMLLPAWYPLGKLPFWALLAIGSGLMAYGFHSLPEKSSTTDWPAWVSRPLFFLLLGLALFLRMQESSRPPGFFNDDHLIISNDIRHILDFGDRPLLFPYGWREPAYCYLGALVWWFMPQATGLFVLHLTSALIDLSTLWALYLLGKELGGRRWGLALTAMGAISKAMIMTSFYGYGVGITLTACAWSLVFLARLMKRPTLAHFVEWGVVLGLGAYSYSPYKVWIPASIGLAWIWVLARKETRPQTRAGWVLAFGLMGGWAYSFLYQNLGFLSSNSFLALGSGFWGKVLGVAVLVPCSYLLGLAGKAKTKKFQWEAMVSKPVVGWAAGSLAAALVVSPLWLHPMYANHTQEVYIFNPRYHLSLLQTLGYLWDNISRFFAEFFGCMMPPQDEFPPLAGDSFLDLYMPLFALVGLVFMVVRRSWFFSWVLVLFGVETLPYVLTHGPHTFRGLGTVVPVLAVALLGAGQLGAQVRAALRPRLSWVPLILFTILMGWSLVVTQKQFHQWMGLRWADPMSYDVFEESLTGCRVYLAPPRENFGNVGKDLLFEGKDVHALLNFNPIPLGPQEKGKDVAVLMNGTDLATKARLEKEFPTAHWFQKVSYWGVTEIVGCVIPFEKLTEKSGTFLYVKRDAKGLWERRFLGGYGLGRGVIRFEDHPARWNDAFPPCAQGNTGVKIHGTWTPTEGDYEMSLHTANPTSLFIDGKETLWARYHDGMTDRKVTLHLGPGGHSVDLVTFFSHDLQVPAMVVHSLKEGWIRPLDELVP